MPNSHSRRTVDRCTGDRRSVLRGTDPQSAREVPAAVARVPGPCHIRLTTSGWEVTFPMSNNAERSSSRVSPRTPLPDELIQTATEHSTACRFEQVRSRDRDQARDLVATYFTPHGLDVLGSPADLDVHLRTRRTSSITLGDLHYGTEVVIRPTRVPAYYKINIPIRGCSVSVFGADEVESYPGQAAVLTPVESFAMRWR